MMNEDYVSFETAKLLKEKGFNEKTEYVHSNNGELLRLNHFGIKDLANTDCNDYHTWQLPIEGVASIISAMKWLREVHNVMISPYALSLGWYFEIFDLTERDITGCKPLYKVGIPDKANVMDTYEEACEEGIKYYIENIMQNNWQNG